MRGRLKDLTFGFQGEQHITVTVQHDFCSEFDRLKDYDISVEIKRWRDPRSKNANAYFHVLVNKIAEAQSLGNDEVKKMMVLEYGTLATDETGSVLGAMIPSNASLDDFYPYAKWYKSMEVNGREYDCYLFYKQTHTLDSKEMARLIDGTIYVAKGLGLETMTPDQLARLEGYEKAL